MPTENRSHDADGLIACDDGLHLIQKDKNLSHYGWVFRKVDGGLPCSVREATHHEKAHAQGCQHLRIGVAQIAGQAPAPQPHPEPIAWMVGTAFWWTKAEAERDAAATGLPLIPVGPITVAAGPAERNPVDPVAWMDPRSPDMHATISNEVKQHNLKFGGAPASAVNGYTIPLYTHADPGEAEDLLASTSLEFGDRLDAVEKERDTLRAQLAEQSGLLKQADEFIEIMTGHDSHARLTHRYGKEWWNPIDDLRKKITARPVSKESKAPSERNENADFESWARSRITPLNLRLDEIGLYHDLVAGTAHDAWQARAALDLKIS